MKTWKIEATLRGESSGDRREKLISLLLRLRGLTSRHAQWEFLQPVGPDKLTPRAVDIDERQLVKAVTLVKRAIKKKQQIVVYGDYDADGICATAIMWEAIHGLGGKAWPFIPQREQHGYGLSVGGLREINKLWQPSLIVTVDNGIVAYGTVEAAEKQGVRVVVTDHHQPGTRLPRATAIVHTTQLSGAGVAWMMAKSLNPAAAGRSLDLVGLATVADMVPVLGANRSLVKFGLDKLRRTERPGLLALYTEAGIDPSSINPYLINFVIAPRLNATGRLNQALDSLRLLSTRNRERARMLAKSLGETNRERQELLESQLNHARELIKTQGAGTEKILIIHHESYHQGIIGLVAGKLTEEFYRPSIVMSVGESFIKASARSIPGFNMIEAIRQAENLLLEAGGHPMAAGFSLAPEKLTEFKEKLRQVGEEKLTEELLQRVIQIECLVEPKDITWELHQELEKLAPFGMGNPQPVLGLMGMTVAESRLVGQEGKHLKLTLLEVAGAEVMGFNLGQLLPQLTPGRKVDVAFQLDKNSWNGRQKLQLKLKDLRLQAI